MRSGHSLALLVAATACGSDIRIASERDEDAFERYCQAYCDYDERCREGNPDDCLTVCRDRDNLIRRRARGELLHAVALCFEELSCTQADDECGEVEVEFPDDPELVDACGACDIHESDCARAHALTAGARADVVDCLAGACSASCIVSTGFQF